MERSFRHYPFEKGIYYSVLCNDRDIFTVVGLGARQIKAITYNGKPHSNSGWMRREKLSKVTVISKEEAYHPLNTNRKGAQLLSKEVDL